MTREFVEQWQQQHPNDTIAYRDVERNPIPHVDESWIVAAFSPPDQHTPQLQEAIRLSDQLITDITFIHVENDEYGGQKLAESIANARAKIIELVAA
jgi:FMN-dependent NADH-azoreductase